MAAGSDTVSRRPRQATRDPPSVSKGAASSMTTGSGPRARAVTTGWVPRSSRARDSLRSATTRTLGKSAATRESQSAFLPSLSTSVTVARPGSNPAMPAALIHPAAAAALLNPATAAALMQQQMQRTMQLKQLLMLVLLQHLHKSQQMLLLLL